MKKLLSLFAVVAVALPMMAAGGTASDAYLNPTQYATIDQAGATVDGMETIYKYTEDPNGTGYWLTLSCYGVMRADATQNWFTNDVTEADNTATYINPWTATDVFQGPTAYFGENTAYTAKFKQPTKYQTFYVTYCTQVKLFAYHRSNSSYYVTKINIYECTRNGDGSITEGTTPVQTIQNTIIGTEILTSQLLDAEKIYKVEVANSYANLYEIAFKTPGEVSEVITPEAYDVTGLDVEHVTMHWSACPGAKSYTVRTYPCDDNDILKGLFYREKFTNCNDGDTYQNYVNLDGYTDDPRWNGNNISGADGGIVIDNNGSVVSPLDGIVIPPYLKKYTIKFKAKPYGDDTDCQLTLISGNYSQTFDISGPEKEYTYVIERELPNYYSTLYSMYIFQNPNYEGNHRVVLTNFKLYYGDFSEPQDGPSTKYVVPAWSGDTTFVSNIPENNFSFGTGLSDISHYNGYSYWIYDVKSVYYDGQESEWSNKIYYSLSPWPEFLEDDDEPIQPIVGDVNGDGQVTTVDITILYNYLLNGDTEFMINGDQDGDGVITSVDVTVVYNVLLGE